jgi:hypothetical protein
MNRSSLLYPVILKAHKRFHVHFTPTSASWLNMVERFFAEITRNLTRRGAFTSVANLKAAIIECLENHNAASKPLVWTMSAGQILEKVVSVISAFGGSARAFFDCSIAVDRFPDRIACAARWVFEAWAIYRDGQEERMQRGSGNEWADVLMHTGPFASQ